MTVDSPFVFDWVRAHAVSQPGAPAIGTPDDGWTTYAQLQSRVASLMEGLRDVGLGAGDFVVQALPASTVSVAAGLAVQAIGAVCVELSRELGQEGFAEVLRQTGAKVAIIEGRDVALWSDLAGSSTIAHLLVVHPTPPPERMLAKLGAAAWTWIPARPAAAADEVDVDVAVDADRDPTAMALLVYTSGSTGTPRGVIQTYRNLDANTRAISRYLGLTADERAMATLPLFYCYGRSVLQTHLLVGASVFFDHRFMYPGVVLGEIHTQRCTSFAGVPLTFESLKRQVDVDSIDLSSLRYLTQAGGAMHPDTMRWVRQVFAPAVLYVMYGQTEATSRLSYLPPERAADKEGSVGRAVDNVELRVVDDAGQPVAPNVVGNVAARGTSITPGYYQAADETAEILRDGWLYTGDLGRIDDDGFLYLVGRTKEFLKLGGNRVSAREIEEVLRRHPAVVDVAVVGTTDADGAEQAVAVVVPADASDADEAALRRHCRQTMPAYKVPRFVRFLDALPLTASNKVARSALQEWINNDSTLLEGRAGPGPGGHSS